MLGADMESNLEEAGLHSRMESGKRTKPKSKYGKGTFKNTNVLDLVATLSLVVL